MGEVGEKKGKKNATVTLKRGVGLNEAFFLGRSVTDGRVEGYQTEGIISKGPEVRVRMIYLGNSKEFIAIVA